MKPPTISVVLCTYNGSAYLREQLDSIVHQTLPPDEIIVQDDASTDSTIALLETYQARCPLTLYRNPVQLGFNRNFLSALLKAKGDYILVSDQDDIWHTHKIETLIRHIGPHSLIFHNSLLFQDTGHLLGTRYQRPPTVHPAYITLKPYIPGHQVLFKKEALPYLEALKDYNIAYDYALSTICANLHGVKYLDESLIYWRRHPQAATLAETRPRPRPLDKLGGYLQALISLKHTPNRQTTQRYFGLLKMFPANEPVARQIIERMSRGTLYGGLLPTCLLCLRQYRALYPGLPPLTARLRSFFLPLVFVRDYGSFIIRPAAPPSRQPGQ